MRYGKSRYTTNGTWESSTAGTITLYYMYDNHNSLDKPTDSVKYEETTFTVYQNETVNIPLSYEIVCPDRHTTKHTITSVRAESYPEGLPDGLLFSNGSITGTVTADEGLYRLFMTHNSTSGDVCTEMLSFYVMGGPSELDESVLPADHEHSYSDWTDNGSETHIRTCAECGLSEIEPHSFDEGEILSYATDVKDGQIRYTCSECGAIKLVTIPAGDDFEVLTNESVISADAVTIGQSVTLTGLAAGGVGAYQYAFYYKKASDTKWSVKQDFNINDTAEIRLSQAAVYDICIKVKDENGSVVKKYFTVNAVDKLTNTSTLAANTVAVGSAVTVNASATGGTAPYTYAVYSKKTTDRSWATVQDFSTDAKVQITLDEEASYDICVKVKDISGAVVKTYLTANAIVAEALENTSTISSENVASGDAVTINASAKGGIADYTYAVYYKESTESKWLTNQDYSSAAAVTFAPPKAVSYDLCVKVRDSSGTIAKKYFTVKAVSNTVTNESVLSAETIQLGSGVTVKAAAAGGTGTYTYAVFFKKTAASTWTTKQGFNTNATVEITPTETGSYDLCVKVKDSSGTVVKKYFIVTVTEALANTSTLSAESVSPGSGVIVRASAAGGTAPYSYAVYYKRSADPSWTTKQNFSATSAVAITPDEAGSYDVCVKVKDSTNTIEKSYLTFVVVDATD